MKLEVLNAIEELKRAFPLSAVLSREDGNGGAYVIVEDVAIGCRYQPSSTWIGGHITAFYPYADIYPLFIADNVRRVDGVAFQPPVTHGAQFLERPALQVSRRNNHTQHYPQTAVAKFLKVLHFLEQL
ncbi:MAG: hypothetical protein OXH11_20610 [Candidatus Aminicenantes bacterium]|nr:hypothetical protein [Candidatus Aminicenantes bacterium]